MSAIEIKTQQIKDYDYSGSDEWHYYIVMDEEGVVSARGHWGNGTPADEWHSRTLNLCRVPNNCADVSNILDELEERRAELEAIHEGHEIIWNGSNLVGGLTKQASETFHKLSNDLEDIREIPTFWEPSEFYDGNFEPEDVKAIFGNDIDRWKWAQYVADGTPNDVAVSPEQLVEYYEELKKRAVEYCAEFAHAAMLALVQGSEVWIADDNSGIRIDDDPEDDANWTELDLYEIW